MIITINGKILKPKKETKAKPLKMSPWFKRWLMVIVLLFLVFLIPSSFLKDEGIFLFFLLCILFGLIIFALVIFATTIITFIKKFLNFKMVIYRVVKSKDI